MSPVHGVCAGDLHSMGNTTPLIKRLREERHGEYYRSFCTASLVPHWGVCVQYRGEEGCFRQLDLLQTRWTLSGDAIRRAGNCSSRRTHEHEDCSCASRTQGPITANDVKF